MNLQYSRMSELVIKSHAVLCVSLEEMKLKNMNTKWKHMGNELSFPHTIVLYVISSNIGALPLFIYITFRFGNL